MSLLQSSITSIWFIVDDVHYYLKIAPSVNDTCTQSQRRQCHKFARSGESMHCKRSLVGRGPLNIFVWLCVAISYKLNIKKKANDM